MIRRGSPSLAGLPPARLSSPPECKRCIRARRSVSSGRSHDMGFNLSAWALKNRSLTVYLMIVAVVAGLFSFVRLGRNEDPSFVLKTMIVQAASPPTSRDRMRTLSSERVQSTLLETTKLDSASGLTRAGVMTIFLSLKDNTAARETAAIWYPVRKIIRHTRHAVGSGVVAPGFKDNFGDPFGI